MFHVQKKTVFFAYLPSESVCSQFTINPETKFSVISSPPLLISLSLTSPTPQQPLQQTQVPLFTLPSIFPKTIEELLGIIPQRLREMTIPIIL